MLKLDTILKDAKGLAPPRGQGPPAVSREVWERAVGSRIARRAQPGRLERGVLEIRVVSAAWANELSFLAEDVRTQLVAGGVKVARLRFVVGRVEPPKHRPEQPRRRAAAPDTPLPEPLRHSMDAVQDPELRRALAAAAAQTLDLGRR